jgi:hypothetical protein
MTGTSVIDIGHEGPACHGVWGVIGAESDVCGFAFRERRRFSGTRDGRTEGGANLYQRSAPAYPPPNASNCILEECRACFETPTRRTRLANGI